MLDKFKKKYIRFYKTLKHVRENRKMLKVIIGLVVDCEYAYMLGSLFVPLFKWSKSKHLTRLRANSY